ncbi:MAG: hypothetical protein U0Z44_18655 [Kouleothrix sp.]
MDRDTFASVDLEAIFSAIKLFERFPAHVSHKEVSMSRPEKKDAQGFTDEERAAMKERAKEMKAEATREQEPGGRRKRPAREDRRDARARACWLTRLHAIITANAPMLSPKTWCMMPA